MDARTLEYLTAMQRIIAFVERHPELQQLTAESKAFELFRDAVTTLENWEPQRRANEMDIQHHRAETDEALMRLLGDLACVQAAAELVPSRVAPLPDFKLPSPREHITGIAGKTHGILCVARKHEAQLVDAGMHPRKLDDVEKSAEELNRAHRQLSMAECYSDAFPEILPLFKEHVRKRYRLLYLELRSAMTHAARVDWKSAASLGRKHRTIGPARAQGALQAPQAMKMLPSATPESPPSEVVSPVKRIGHLAGRAIRRVIGEPS